MSSDFNTTVLPAAVQVKSVAIEQSRAQVRSVAFPGPRGPAGMLIKGPWDMTGAGGGVTSYPLDGDPTAYAEGDVVPFETIVGDSHGFTVQEGSIAGFVPQLALTDHQVQAVAAGGTVGNLGVPDSGIAAVEFEYQTTASAAPGAGTVAAIASVLFGDEATQRQLFISIIFVNSSGNQLVSANAIYYEGGNLVWQAQQFTEPLTLPGDSRGTVYVDGATRQVGIILNGVDKGWLLDNVTSDPITLAPEVTGLAIQKMGYWLNIPAADPIIGATVACTHNINPATLIDAGLLPEAPQEWNLLPEAALPEAALPDGAEPGDVFEVTVGGTYQGVTFGVGDLAVVRSNGTSVTRLPAGTNGIDGEDGNNGWTPILAVVEDGERRVQQVVDWADGTGTKPTTGLYVGTAGLVADIGDAADIRGGSGADGINGTDGTDGTDGADGADGADGNNGWSPVWAIVADGERRVVEITDWTGGTGTKPGTGYLGVAGIVAAIGDAADIRGPAGAGGAGGQKIYVDVFTSSDNWTKRSGAMWVRGKLVGAGSGGGSGRMSNTGEAAFGGAGGCGGSVTDFEMSALDLPGTVAVVVGAGGVGGAARTIVTNGQSGAAGGDTTFGTYWHALGGSATGTASTSNATSGGAVKGFPNTAAGITGLWVTGGVGGTGSSGGGNVSTQPLYAPGGGAGGGGVSVGGTASGGGACQQNTVAVGTTSGPRVGYLQNNGGTAGNNGNPGANSPMPNSGLGAQGGSGGGGSSSASPAGDGGAGGFPGAGGGGGGGANTNAPSSGAGGNGGNGIAIIITYCE